MGEKIFYKKSECNKKIEPGIVQMPAFYIRLSALNNFNFRIWYYAFEIFGNVIDFFNAIWRFELGVSDVKIDFH